MLEVAVVPFGPVVVARHTVAVEVGGDGRAVDAELGSQPADRGAGTLSRDEVVDGGGGEALLGRVCKPSHFLAKLL